LERKKAHTSSLFGFAYVRKLNSRSEATESNSLKKTYVETLFRRQAKSRKVVVSPMAYWPEKVLGDFLGAAAPKKRFHVVICKHPPAPVAPPNPSSKSLKVSHYVSCETLFTVQLLWCRSFALRGRSQHKIWKSFDTGAVIFFSDTIDYYRCHWSLIWLCSGPNEWNQRSDIDRRRKD